MLRGCHVAMPTRTVWASVTYRHLTYIGIVSTLADVANLAGVGIGTASRALSGNGYVDDATRRRVHEAAAQLQYRGNAAARALRARRTRVVGLLMPDMTNEFYNSAAEVLQNDLFDAGFQLVVAQTSARLGDEQRAWESMLGRQVDGVVHVSFDPAGTIPDTLPVVQLNRRSEGAAVPAVLSDDEAGIQALTQHVIDRGHHDLVAIAGPPWLSTTRARLAGFRRALARADIPEVNEADGTRGRPRARILSSELSADGGAAAFESVIDDPPSAVVAMSSRFVLGVLSVCKRRSIRVPEDLSIAGFNDPDWFSVWTPGITTYAPPLAAMGLRASREIVAAIQRWDEHGAPAPEVIRLAGSLRLRESVGRPV